MPYANTLYRMWNGIKILMDTQNEEKYFSKESICHFFSSRSTMKMICACRYETRNIYALYTLVKKIVDNDYTMSLMS